MHYSQGSSVFAIIIFYCICSKQSNLSPLGNNTCYSNFSCSCCYLSKFNVYYDCVSNSTIGLVNLCESQTLKYYILNPLGTTPLKKLVPFFYSKTQIAASLLNKVSFHTFLSAFSSTDNIILSVVGHFGTLYAAFVYIFPALWYNEPCQRPINLTGSRLVVKRVTFLGMRELLFY